MLALLSLLLAALANADAAPQDRPRVLTLEHALALALERNADLRRSALQVSSAEADKLQARAAILPRLDFNASVSRNRTGGGEVTGSFVDPTTGNTVLLRSPTQVFSSYTAGLNLQQLIFDGGKWWNNLEAGNLALAAARESSEEARLQTTFQTQADVYAARANRDNDEVNRLAQEARVELARQDLAVAIGADPSESIAVEEPPRLFEEPAPPPPADDAVAKALSSRPSLKAFAHAAESQRRAAAAASGDYWPAISLAAGYNRQTWDFGAFTSSPDKASTLSVGVILTWNLFNGFATTAQVTKAQVQALQAENDLRSARTSIAADVEKAIAQLAVARQLAQVATRAEENAREGLRLARTRQEVGAGTQLEVRDAELKLTQSQLARVGALVGGREAEAALRRAMGGS